MARLEEVLGAVRAAGGVVGISAIDGMAGVGKTALAVHAAHRLAPEFPDGQIFLRLHGHTPGQRPLQPDAALTALLLAMGLGGEQIPAGLEARAALLRDRMAGKRMLLLLDDAAGSEQIRPLIPSGAGSLALITSRQRLEALPEATRITLDTLAPGEAADLFRRLSDRGDDASELIMQCGYLPLAITLMAGRLKHHPAWNVADLTAELSTAKNRLSRLSAENISVSSAFDLSYRNLNPGQQQLFRRLGLQPGTDIDAYGAAALDDNALTTARRLLDDLYSRHLIDEPTRGRYRMHDLIRQHARALAAADPPNEHDGALGRLLDYYLHTALAADRHLARRTHTCAPPELHRVPAHCPEFIDPAQASGWMAAERTNLQAAAEFAARHDRAEHAVWLPIAMHGYLRTHGHWDQALSLHRQALTAARRCGDQAGSAETLNNLGVIQRLAGDYDAANGSLSEAFALYQAFHNELGQANTLSYLGVVRRLSKDHDAAVDALTDALGLYTRIGDRLGLANVGLTRAHALYQSLGNRLGAANALKYRGMASAERGDADNSQDDFRAALQLYREMGNSVGEASIQKMLA